MKPKCLVKIKEFVSKNWKKGIFTIWKEAIWPFILIVFGVVVALWFDKRESKKEQYQNEMYILEEAKRSLESDTIDFNRLSIKINDPIQYLDSIVSMKVVNPNFEKVLYFLYKARKVDVDLSI